MKFGKDLQQYKLPGWEDDYLDYKGLKYILKKLEEGVPREEVDGEFFQALEDDLEKVNRAFLERCNAIEATIEMSQESAPASTAAEGETSESTAARDRAAQTERDRQQGVVYYEAYRTLGRLQTFVWINTKGFQKIMKKYDKRQQLRGTGNELGPDFEKRLEKEAFCSGKLEVLMELFKQRRPNAASGSAMGGGGGRRTMQLLAGNGNPELAEEISARLGVPLTPATISRFADGEVSIQILENVRNSDVYIIQPTCPPVNDNLMELLLCASALPAPPHRASRRSCPTTGMRGRTARTGRAAHLGGGRRQHDGGDGYRPRLLR